MINKLSQIHTQNFHKRQNTKKGLHPLPNTLSKHSPKTATIKLVLQNVLQYELKNLVFVVHLSGEGFFLITSLKRNKIHSLAIRGVLQPVIIARFCLQSHNIKSAEIIYCFVSKKGDLSETNGG